MTTKTIQNSVREAGCSLKREEYILGFTVTLLTTRRLIFGHKWFIRENATGIKVCEGTNPVQCYKRFLLSKPGDCIKIKVLPKPKFCLKILPE